MTLCLPKRRSKLEMLRLVCGPTTRHRAVELEASSTPECSSPPQPVPSTATSEARYSRLRGVNTTTAKTVECRSPPSRRPKPLVIVVMLRVCGRRERTKAEVFVGAIVICAAAHAHAQQPPATGDYGRICGQVVNVTCNGTEPPNLSIVVDRVYDSVRSVEVKPAFASLDVRSDERHDARPRATALLFRRVCASVTLKDKPTSFQPAAFEVANIDHVTEQTGDPAEDGVHPGVYRTCDSGVELPKVQNQYKPRYTVNAMRAGVQGAVWVEAIVEMNGHVSDTKVLRSLDAGDLDREAVKAAKRWRFIPGTKDGRPAPILVTIELTFRLKDKQQ